MKQAIERAEATMQRTIKGLVRELERNAISRVASMDKRELMAEGCREMAAYWRGEADTCVEMIDRDECLSIANQAERFADQLLTGEKVA